MRRVEPTPYDEQEARRAWLTLTLREHEHLVQERDGTWVIHSLREPRPTWRSRLWAWLTR